MHPLLPALLLIPGLPAAAVPPSDFDGACLLVDQADGAGSLVAAGQLATLSMNIDTLEGRRLIDTDLRGLPYTIKVGDADDAIGISTWIAGMRRGGERWVYLPGIPGPDDLIPPGTPLLVRLRLLEEAR